MKKILVALSLMLAVSPVMAQTKSADASNNTRTEKLAKLSPEERATRHADKLQKKLNLSADQRTKVLAVNMEVMKRKQALKARGGQVDKSAFKEIRKYRQEQYAAILSPAQMEQLKAFQAEQRQKHKARMMKKHAQHTPASSTPAQSPVQTPAPKM